jgi:hypothetical protein
MLPARDFKFFPIYTQEEVSSQQLTSSFSCRKQTWAWLNITELKLIKLNTKQYLERHKGNSKKTRIREFGEFLIH